MRLADKEEHAGEIRALMEESWAQFEAPPPVFGAGQSEAMLRAVLGHLPDTIPVRRIPWRRAAAAAVLIGALGLGIWWVAHTPRPVAAPLAAVEDKPAKPTIAAGGNKAVLILDNGSTVTLDSAKTGVLTTQGNTRVIKLAGGRLNYAGEGTTSTTVPGSGNRTASTAVLYNMVRTPRGGQYQVELPDGSKVWLNAATTLRFPTAFSGKERTVELTGEAYFEVAANKNQPFKVKVGDMTIDVLGTHFNVMAYDDEGSFHTTLLTGAVRVEEGTEARLLKPGEEARMSLDTKNLTIAVADTDQVVAWKNGLFQFDGATLETVLRQVARWYDVDVRYEGTIPKHFSGGISRSASLAEVLHVLDKAGKTRFVLEGRTVVVRPK